MLELGRIDTVAGNEMAIDYLMMQAGIAGKFDKGQYKYIPKEGETGVYLVLSKKSVHSDKLSEISKIVDQMKKIGRIDTYVKKYTTPNH